MKKIIILAIATLSTGIVLSNSLKKPNDAIKPVTLETQKNAPKTAAPSYSAVGQAD